MAENEAIDPNNPMPRETPESVKEAVANNPGLTSPPTQIVLESEPIPNPNLPNQNK